MFGPEFPFCPPGHQRIYPLSVGRATFFAFVPTAKILSSPQGQRPWNEQSGNIADGRMEFRSTQFDASTTLWCSARNTLSVRTPRQVSFTEIPTFKELPC